MKIIVAIKQVPDRDAPVRIGTGGKWIEESDMQYALNEPDANLHPKLYEPLADLITRAARHSQLWITTHSQSLADLLREKTAARLIQLEKHAGATHVLEDAMIDE